MRGFATALVALISLGITAGPGSGAAQQPPGAAGRPGPDTTLNQNLDPLPLQFDTTGTMLRDGASVLLDPRYGEDMEFTNPQQESAQTARLLPGISLVIPFTSPSVKDPSFGRE